MSSNLTVPNNISPSIRSLIQLRAGGGTYIRILIKKILEHLSFDDDDNFFNLENRSLKILPPTKHYRLTVARRAI